MKSGTLTADGSTDWIPTLGREINPVANGTFGGGTMSLEKRVDGVTSPAYDSGVGIAITASDDMIVSLGAGIEVRWTLSGSTTPSINWSLFKMDSRQ